MVTCDKISNTDRKHVKSTYYVLLP